MPDQAFQRTPIYPLEKPICDDINQDASQGDRSLRDFIGALFSGASGFLNGGLLVAPQSPVALGVVIKAGFAFQNAPTDTPTNIGGVAGVNDLSAYKPIVLAADYSIAVPTPPGSNSRIDLIEVAYDRRLDNPQSRNFLDTGTGAFVPASVAKTLDFTVDGTLAYYAAAATPTTALAYKSGVSGVSPVAPTVDTGYMALAYIVVASGVTTIVGGNITDERSLLFQRGLYLGRQVISITGTYTPAPGAGRARVRMSGGGGGGGGCLGGASAAAAAGGGASGRYVEIEVIGAPLITGGAATIGFAGGGGGSGNHPGTIGGDTTLVINGATITAKGGGGAPAGNPPLAISINAGGTLTAGSTAGDVNAGEDGHPGTGFNTAGVATGTGGNGGGNPLGTGGRGGQNSDGTNGSGFGGGGGGAENHVTTNNAGGSGSSGGIIIDEWT